MEKNESQGELNALHENQQNGPILVDVPMMNYITYCGVGHPSGEDFRMAITALPKLAHIIKVNAIEEKLIADYDIAPFEIDWLKKPIQVEKKEDAETKGYMSVPPAALKKAAKKKEAERLNLDEYENASYRWDLMIRQPDCITSLLYGQALLQAIKSKPDISFAKIRFVCREYGECIQCLHLGHYINLHETITKISVFAKANRYVIEPLTHDVYLTDLRTTPPENAKTIVRAVITHVEVPFLGDFNADGDASFTDRLKEWEEKEMMHDGKVYLPS